MIPVFNNRKPVCQKTVLPSLIQSQHNRLKIKSFGSDRKKMHADAGSDKNDLIRILIKDSTHRHKARSSERELIKDLGTYIRYPMKMIKKIRSEPL